MKRLETPKWEAKKRKKRLMWLVGAAVLIIVPLVLGSAYILSKTLAKSSENSGDVYLSEPEIKGDKIFVRKGDSFQRALNRAKPGDTILLQAGATFKGAFVLPKKGGSQFITIRSSAPASRFPPPNRRIDPKKYGSSLPKLESNVKGKPVILATNGAHHFRFVGIEFMPTIEGLYNIIAVGTGDETKEVDLPHHIEFDRVYIHGSDSHGQRRGIAANGRHLRIVNSYISNIKRKGEESQAIASWATDGPIVIENNYLEAAGENILFGGAGSPLMLIPTDCIIRKNHLNKPLVWKGTDWVVKNLFEVKSGKDFKIEYNLMTNNWGMAQDGTAVLFNTRADNKNVVIENIEFSNNIIRGVGNAINVYGPEGNGGRNLVVRNNFFIDIDGSKWNSSGHFMIGTTWTNLRIENNTVIHTGNVTNLYGKPIKGLIFRNNIVSQNKYGFIGDGTSPGKETLDRFLPGAKITNNIIIGSDSSLYGRKNFYPSSIRQIGFRDFKDYLLKAESPYRTRGFGGKSVGANLDPKKVGGN